MSHGFELEPVLGQGNKVPLNPVIAAMQRVVDSVNALLLRISMLALILTSGVLTYSVVTRYLLRSATDWQDEVAVFMLVGATFVTTAHVQFLRGHVGIEAVTSILPAWINRIRAFLVDFVSAAFCAFFSWKSWSLFHEAWVEGQTTSSSFAPPLWIPYSLMSLGMSLLTFQLLLQTLVHVTGGEVTKGEK